MCSFAQMTYGQWATSEITTNPMDSMKTFIASTKYANEKVHSYSRIYSSISGLNASDYTPEVAYFTYKAGLDNAFASLNFTNIMVNMDGDHLFNQEMWGDLLLNKPRDYQKDFDTT